MKAKCPEDLWQAGTRSSQDIFAISDGENQHIEESKLQGLPGSPAGFEPAFSA